MEPLTTDYLVVGAGASGLVFSDVLVAESDADVVLVDRRTEVGGHWNDAYPFVRLHQPSATYGMPSLPLGSDRVVDGQYERATGAEVLDHFRRGFCEVLLPTGRVRFVGGVDVDLDRTPVLRDLATGETTEVVVRRKVVDARYRAGELPATHTPSYDVAPGAPWVRVGQLPEARAAASYVVVGAGKTGMDTCLHLLGEGVDADAITWVRPRDPWLQDRASLQPLDGVAAVLEAMSLDLEALALATSETDLFARLEASGRLLRLDDAVAPTAFRCAIVDRDELVRLRSVRRVVRLGHVRAVELHRLCLQQGEIPLPEGALVVDCSARGLGDLPPVPIFSDQALVLQDVRQCSPNLGAAVAAWVEVHRSDLEEQNRLCPPNPAPSVPRDWLQQLAVSMTAARAWRDAPDLRAWLDTCRLDIAGGAADHAHEPRMQEAFLRRQTHLQPALTRLGELLTR